MLLRFGRQYEHIGAESCVIENQCPTMMLSMSGKYSIIYADPPWQYEHVRTESQAIENPYPIMVLEGIKQTK